MGRPSAVCTRDNMNWRSISPDLAGPTSPPACSGLLPATITPCACICLSPRWSNPSRSRCAGRPASLWRHNSAAGPGPRRRAERVGANRSVPGPQRWHQSHWPDGRRCPVVRIGHRRRPPLPQTPHRPRTHGSAHARSGWSRTGGCGLGVLPMRLRQCAGPPCSPAPLSPPRAGYCTMGTRRGLCRNRPRSNRARSHHTTPGQSRARRCRIRGICEKPDEHRAWGSIWYRSAWVRCV